MPTHARLAADLLEDAAVFFKTLAAENEPVREKMAENSNIYAHMAELISNEPAGKTENGQAYSDLVAKMLHDTAKFFRKIAAQNPPIREQLEQNADTFDKVAEILREDPTGAIAD